MVKSVAIMKVSPTTPFLGSHEVYLLQILEKPPELELQRKQGSGFFARLCQ
jgi:hypothetical protein